jgi:hypothetical protein
MKLLQKNWLLTLLIILSAGAYLLLGYEIPRQNFPALLGLFALLFAGYFCLFRSRISIKNGLVLALFFRVLLLFSTPALSDDYFRFLWDGRLLTAGENPFLHVPQHYAENNFQGLEGLDQELFAGLNSPAYFSVYPPVCQFFFAVTGFAAPGNLLAGIMLLRLAIILAELAGFWLFIKLLSSYNLPARNVLWYALNPLVIMELSDNLHFEALVITFTLAAFYFLTQNRYRFSAIMLGLAVCTKLIPLLLLPFLVKRLGLKKAFLYFLITGLTCLVLFLPFVTPELITHFGSSLNLYFQKFEFNASVYYILRWLGFYFYGYNQIAILGILLSAATFLGILLLAFREKNVLPANLPLRFLQALTIYYLLATIVHPWYITTLVAMAVISNRRYPLVWSGLAVLSYAAYQTSSYSENPWLIFLEYAGLAIAIFFDYRNTEKPVLVPKKSN